MMVKPAASWSRTSGMHSVQVGPLPPVKGGRFAPADQEAESVGDLEIVDGGTGELDDPVTEPLAGC